MEGISCITNVYKNDVEEYLTEAITSILTQTLKPKEIIIVRDGIVGDKMENILVEYEHEYDFIKIIRLEKNVGLGIGRQIAVNACQCDIVATMDSDDISVSNRFELQYQYLKTHPEIDIVGGYISEFDNKTKKVIGLRKVPLTNSEIIEYNNSRCPMNHVTVMMRKDAVLKAGNYQHLLYNEDYYLWCRMIQAGCAFANLPEILVNVRSGLEQFERRGGRKYFDSEKEIQKWLFKNKRISYLKMKKNILIRFIVQILLPNSVRGFLFKNIFHKNR